MQLSNPNRRILQAASVLAGSLAIMGLIAPIASEPMGVEAYTMIAFSIGGVGLATLLGMASHGAASEGRIFVALVLGAITLLGSMLLITEQAGRRAQHSQKVSAAFSVSSSNRERLTAELARSQAMLAEAQRSVASECSTGLGKMCRGRQATEMVYRNAVIGLRQQLGELPIVTGNPKEEAAVEAAILFGWPSEWVRRLVRLLDPIAWPVWLEITSIVAGIFGFSPRKSGNVSKVSTGNDGNIPAGNDNFRPVHAVTPTGVGQPVGLTDYQLIVQALKANGGVIESQTALAASLGCSKGEVSKRLSGLAGNPEIIVETNGRRNQVRLVDVKDRAAPFRLRSA